MNTNTTKEAWMHIDIVQRHREQLGPSAKFAGDLAFLLDWANQAFEVTAQRGMLLPSLAHEALHATERFNAVLVQHGCDPVVIDSRWAWPLAQLSRGYDKRLNAQAYEIYRRIIDLATVDEMFAALEPQLQDPYMAQHATDVISAVQCFRGLMPSRQRLTDTMSRDESHRLAPKEPLTVCCLDDDPDNIMRTFGAMAGWPGLNFIAMLQPIPPSTQSSELTRNALANDIVKSGAQIILMDQGLRNTSGSEVILEVRRQDLRGARVFVSNTGGDAHSFAGTGAIGDCQKGRYLDGIEDAIRILEKESASSSSQTSPHRHIRPHRPRR